jgi:hypothetical protein
MAHNGYTFWPEPPPQRLDFRVGLTSRRTNGSVQRNRHPDDDDRGPNVVDDLFNATMFHRPVTDTLNRFVRRGHRSAAIAYGNTDTPIT